MYVLIFGLLRVADILSNPFGYDYHYDIELAATLDHNIWKASLSLESQDRALETELLRQKDPSINKIWTDSEGFDEWALYQ